MVIPSPDHPSLSATGVPSVPPSVRQHDAPRRTGPLDDPILVALARAVGGVEAIVLMRTDPWPAQPFDRTLCATERDHDRVDQVLAVLAAGPECLVDEQYRDIATRLAERALMATPERFHAGPPARVAAALAWLALRGNGGLAPGHDVSPTMLWRAFGVGTCAALGRAIHADLGLAAPPVASPLDRTCRVWLPEPRLLHAATRAVLQLLWTRRLGVLDPLGPTEPRSTRPRAAALAARRTSVVPVTRPDSGRILARPSVPRWAVRGVTDAGRTYLCVAVQQGDDAPLLLGLTVPDARELVHLLSEALDAPCHLRR